MNPVPEHHRAKGKHREEFLQNLRETLAALESEYGLTLGGEHSVEVAAEAKRLQLPQPLLNNRTIVIPCRVGLIDDSTADPSLIVPSTWPAELLPAHKRLAVGGQVNSVSRSPYSLPAYVMNAAWRSTESWMGEVMPILVIIDGEEKYLVRANTWFFRCGRFRGVNIDHSYIGEPNERDLKRGTYVWGDDMTEEMTLVVAKL